MFGLYVNPASIESEMITPESELVFENTQATSNEDVTVDSIQSLMGEFDDE